MQVNSSSMPQASYATTMQYTSAIPTFPISSAPQAGPGASFTSAAGSSPSTSRRASITSTKAGAVGALRKTVSPLSPLRRLQSENGGRSASSSSSSSIASTSSLRLASTASATSSTQAPSVMSSMNLDAAAAAAIASAPVTIDPIVGALAGPVLTREQKQKQAAIDSQMRALYESEYRDEVLEYMYEMESSTMASVELIDMQPELAWYMRPYLIDFLIEIHSQYRLRPETLFLAINIVDRYVSRRIVYKKHYQLVGCAALWIASKFEDAKDRVPTVEDLCAVCCSAYDQSAFIQMEGHVLSTIGWLLGHPTAEAWLRVACCPSPTTPMEDTRTQHVARFIMEITLFHRAFVPIKPSDIAQSCLLLARYICAPDASASRVTNNERIEAVKIAQMLDAHLAEHLEQVSATVVKKYSPSFYSRASVFVREWYLSGRRFAAAELSLADSQPAHTSDVDMSPSSSSSTDGGRDSDFDEREDDEEDYSTGPSSEPITPTTSVCSSACSSDPFDAASASRGEDRTLHPKAFAQASLHVPTRQQAALRQHSSHEDMQWQ